MNPLWIKKVNISYIDSGGVRLKNNIKEILNHLDKEEIDCITAVNLIKNPYIYKSNRMKKGTKLKINVISGNQSIKIPSIPFWLIDFFISMGLSFGAIALKFVKDLDEDTKEILNSIDIKDFKLIFKELKQCGPFELVDVDDERGALVKISIL